MRTDRTKTDIESILHSMKIVVDSREQKCGHITDFFRDNAIEFTCRGLKTGDYSIVLPANPDMGIPRDTMFDDEIVIERKAHLDEIAANFSRDRKRFENEFIRAKSTNTRIILLIENASWDRIAAHAYRSELSPLALRRSLLSWQAKYDMTVNFCEPQDSGDFIYQTLYFWIKNKLECGKV